MKVIANTPDRLSLCYRKSLWWTLAIGLTFMPGGIFFVLLGLAMPEMGNIAILPIGVGSSLVVGGAYFASLAEVITYTFEKGQTPATADDRVAQGSLRIERRALTAMFQPAALEFPLYLISEVGIRSYVGAELDSLFEPFMMLSPVNWQISIRSDQDFQSAAQTTKQITQFLGLPCKIEKLNPLSGVVDRDEPWQFSWQILPTEIERLEQIVVDHPEDAVAHQRLGIVLYQANRSRYRQTAIEHLHKSADLFTSQQQMDSAIASTTIATLIAWKYGG
jgi:hypothetical protein